MNFSIRKQTLRRTDSERIISDSVNYLVASFTFYNPNEWTDLTRMACFKKGANVYEEILVLDSETGKYLITSDMELNLTSGDWEVSVVGVEMVGNILEKRITTNVVDINVEQAGALGGEAFPEIGGAIGEQILQSEADRVAAEAEREAWFNNIQQGIDKEISVLDQNGTTIHQLVFSNGVLVSCTTV